MLSDSDSDANDLHTITINEHFAKAFENKKEREELAKLKEKYGSDYSGSDASDDSGDSEDTDEDSDGEELTPAVDAAILRTLALIKKKDPAIYEGGRRVFDEEHTRTQYKAPVAKSKTKEKLKPLTIREAALASTLAEVHSSRSQSSEPPPLTHSEEQALLRSETRAAFHGAVNSESEEGDNDDLLVPRSRTRDEIELEEEEYKAFLEREVGEDIHNLITVEENKVMDAASGDIQITKDGSAKHERKKKKQGKKEREKQDKKGRANEVQATKQHDQRPKGEADLDFLMNYIFNRGWIDRSNRRLPTYNEIVESTSKQFDRKSYSQVDLDGNNEDQESVNEQGDTLSDENSFDDFADAFESSYNFRFEEPGGAQITAFPRNISSARRESTTRKDARVRKKERQQAEKQALLEARREEIRRERVLIESAVVEEDGNVLMIGRDTSEKRKSKRQQRRDELARLKVLKANELRRKLEMVSSEGGLEGISDEALLHLDFDADWDSSKHDAQMAELYSGDDGFVDDGDRKKPIWDDDINIDDIIPPANTKSKVELKKLKKKERNKNKNKNTDDDVGVDVDEMDADADWDNRNENDEEWRGTEEERKRKVDAYMDEVVNRLGFSGITSHIPTRFHYTSTAPENYSLTPAEILLATDAELNSYVGLRKMAPYRIDKGGKGKKNWDPKRVQRLTEFRENLYSRVGSNHEGPWSLDGGATSKSRVAEAQGEKKKRKGKKERAKLRAMQGEIGKEDGNQSEGGQSHKDSDDASPLRQLHTAEAEVEAEDGPRRKRRKRCHKKRADGGSQEEKIA